MLLTGCASESSKAILKMHLTRQRRAGAQWSANIRGGLKTGSNCSNTNPTEADSTFESACDELSRVVFALPLDVICYF